MRSLFKAVGKLFKTLTVLVVIIALCSTNSFADLSNLGGIREALIPNAEDGQILIKFKAGTSPNQKDNILRKSDLGTARSKLKSGADKIKFSDGRNPIDVAKELSADPGVEYAEPNYIAKIDATTNDPLYGNEWHLDKIGAPTAWDYGTGNFGPIAIIDTGIVNHSDLTANITGGINTITGANPVNYVDDNGHGTFVAGITAAITNNGIGVASISKGAPILAVKALDSNGEGSYGDISNGIIYATDSGVKIINLSLGAPYYSQTLTDAVSYAMNNGVIVVASTGNEGTSVLNYPAAINGVVGIGASNQSDQKAGFSSFGSSVDVVAPGTNIYSTYNNGGYAIGSGTSASAPIVSGLLSLIMSNGTTANNAISRMYRTADKIGSYSYNSSGTNSYFGHGRINAARMLKNTYGTSPVYRLYSDYLKTHLYTTDQNEVNILRNNGIWRYEGVAYQAVSSGYCQENSPYVEKIYRLYSDYLKTHLYTTDQNEVNVLRNNGIWRYEGVAYCSGTGVVDPYYTSSPNKKVYRLYAEYLRRHLYTTDQNEVNVLRNNGIWRYEGVAYRAF